MSTVTSTSPDVTVGVPGPGWRRHCRGNGLGGCAGRRSHDRRRGCLAGRRSPAGRARQDRPRQLRADHLRRRFIGGVLVALLNRRSCAPRQRFFQVTIGLTVLSLLVPAAFADTGASKIALVGLHLIAAAIIVPVLAGHAD